VIKKFFRCKNCLNCSTRPRIEFDERGWCNACQWMEKKKILNWDERQEELKTIIKNAIMNKKGVYDCLVAVSGGKDGTYVTHQLKEKFNLNVLTITVRPPLELEISKKNLENFIAKGINNILISPSSEVTAKLDKIGLIKYGQGYYGWLISIHTAILKIANKFDIGLIFYSEDGEIEYGGSTSTINQSSYNQEFMKEKILNNTYYDVINSSGLNKNLLYWHTFLPADVTKELTICHWSYFEAWDPYRNYLLAKENYGLSELEEANTGTFTNFAQNDQSLASLHYYLMFLKFGFGRATQDAGIEIRRSAMTREQAIPLVSIYDGIPPVENYDIYCDYFKMERNKFEELLDSFANKYLLEKVEDRWILKDEYKLIF